MFFYGNANESNELGIIFLCIRAVKKVKFVSDRVLYIIGKCH
jgi:hypothetical protein